MYVYIEVISHNKYLQLMIHPASCEHQFWRIIFVRMTNNDTWIITTICINNKLIPINLWIGWVIIIRLDLYFVFFLSAATVAELLLLTTLHEMVYDRHELMHLIHSWQFILCVKKLHVKLSQFCFRPISITQCKFIEWNHTIEFVFCVCFFLICVHRWMHFNCMICTLYEFADLLSEKKWVIHASYIICAFASCAHEIHIANLAVLFAIDVDRLPIHIIIIIFIDFILVYMKIFLCFISNISI